MMYGKKASAKPTMTTEYMHQTNMSRNLPGVHSVNVILGRLMRPNISGIDAVLWLVLVLLVSFSEATEDSLSLDMLSRFTTIALADNVEVGTLAFGMMTSCDSGSTEIELTSIFQNVGCILNKLKMRSNNNVALLIKLA